MQKQNRKNVVMSGPVKNAQKSGKRTSRRGAKPYSSAQLSVLADCNRLLELAVSMWPKDPALAVRYVTLAFKTAMRHRVHLDPKRFCRKCFVPFLSDTLTVRQSRQNQTVLYSCRKCNTIRRIPYRH